MHNIIKDLSDLTTIPTSALTKLADRAVLCMCNCVEESILENKQLTEMDLGIGTIQVLVDGNELKYRFIPSKQLDSAMKSTVIDKSNPLTAAVEATLVRRILNTYKNYL